MSQYRLGMFNNDRGRRSRWSIGSGNRLVDLDDARCSREKRLIPTACPLSQAKILTCGFQDAMTRRCWRGVAFSAADLATLRSIYPLGRRHRSRLADVFAVSCRGAGTPWLIVSRQSDG